MESVYSTADCSDDALSLTVTNFPVPESSCPFVCKASPCAPYVGVDQKPVTGFYTVVECPSSITNDPTALFNASSYFGTTTWDTNTCNGNIVGAMRYALNQCLPRPTAVAPYPTASWKWTSCESVVEYSDEACQTVMTTTTSNNTPPPNACNPRQQCCTYGSTVFLNAICVGDSGAAQPVKKATLRKEISVQ